MSLIESATRHDAMVSASEAQRLRRAAARTGDRWSSSAGRFTSDPRRDPDANLQAILDLIATDDVLLDVGGGAGRYSLPAALRCREVVNVEPAAGMGAAFETSAAEAGITNARWMGGDWLSADVTGDVSLVVHVTYFVPEIVPFVEKLNSATRRLVIIGTCVTPPPNQGAAMYEAINGEPVALVPGYRALLDVLWDMSIVPEVRVLETAEATSLGGVFASREAAVSAAVAGAAGDAAELTRRIESQFDALFVPAPGGFRRKPSGDPRMMLITWHPVM